MGKISQKRVLIVDDAALVRLYYREALERAGYQVEEALNGLEALEKVMFSAVDLLIVDINMPQMDGMTFLKMLRKQDQPTGSTLALVTSTEGAPHDIAAARAAGANYYLTKPLAQDALIAHVDAMLGAGE